MDVEVAGYSVPFPGISVISKDGRTAVVYDPYLGTPDSSSNRIYFAIEDENLVSRRADGAILVVLPEAEIEHLSVAMGGKGDQTLIAQLTDGDKLELLTGIPYPTSAARLAAVMQQQLNLPYKQPERSPETEEGLPVVSPSSSHSPVGRFAYPSRPLSKLLLVLLGTLWIILVFTSIFSYLTRPEATALDNTNADVITNWGLVLYGLLIILASIAFVVFLLWISKVHKDLGALSPEYPITPKRAVAQAGIPIFNLWGIQNIFKTMSDRKVPNIEWIMRFAYLPLLWAMWKTFRGDSALLVNLGWLGFVTFSMIITWNVNQSLAASIGEVIYELSSRRAPTKRQSTKRRLKIGLAIVALAACGIFALGAIYVPRIIEGVVDFQKEWYDEDFDQLMGALGKRWDPDDSIPYAAANIHFLTYGEGQSEVWLLIDLQTTTRCTLRAGDPCKAPADEFGRIVLENYPKVDKLDGLQVIVTHVDSAGVLELMRSVDARHSIPAWRSELENTKVAGDV